MEYIYSALLLNSAEKELNESNVTKVLEAAGITVDAGRVKALIAALDGADIAGAIENATKAPVAVAGAAPAAAAEAPVEEEEEEVGVSEDEAAAGLGALFG